jgi:uncharacterized membrane protein HdeD (DUF308 family)
MMNLTRNWWLVVLRGVLAILFGIAAFFMPGLAWLSLIVLFGAYAILDGVFAMMSGLISSKYSRRWWVFLLEGLISVAAGAIALVRPDIASLVLVLLIAAWAVFTGILELVAAIRLRREITNEWMLGLSGFVSIVLGVLLFFQPAAGGLVVTLMIGAYALIFGAALVGLGFRLRRWNSAGSERDVVRAARS